MKVELIEGTVFICNELVDRLFLVTDFADTANILNLSEILWFDPLTSIGWRNTVSDRSLPIQILQGYKLKKIIAIFPIPPLWERM